ncbi:BON domain-containing protein [Legionella jamestowniensis]|uniref:Putative periplasmic or secreted lipoprotein n=1 Tax=Legionella jamestowniensis TaxID=455 RepID=A0A0W0UZV1_9GAMM|nr:BON domain-containing protein [Legionella jamestowniensis]KTD13383.1 putative periplasmic or secreted lipoprotein [Legionella jamestowniensis]OCH98406.1 transporter [Legionella jamestowniensis]SFL76203.1 BON domain-containing protein [Legionella jamestowniensis DSM 19215]
MLKIIKLFISSLLITFIVACTATPTRESTGQYLDSAAITAKVKAELIDKLGAKGFSIKVKTYKDLVQLSGFVNSAVIKQRAGIIAGRVDGVKRVRNDLIVK